MKYICLQLFVLLSLLYMPSALQAQIEVNSMIDLTENQYPEGVYYSFESFLKRVPDKQVRVETRDVYKPKTVIDDPLIDNCYFYYKRTKKRVTDAFAISYRGSLYIHFKSMQKHMEKKDKRQRMIFKDSFNRVFEQGKYLYLEGYYQEGRSGLGFSIGAGPIAIGTGGGSQEQLKGIVFDYEKEQFDVFRDCKDFNRFLAIGYRSMTIECNSKEAPMPIVREILYEINSMGL